MKSLALILAVFGSSVLLAQAFTPDVHDPAYRKTTSFIEKGDDLDTPQQGSSAVHKHSDNAPHHDDSHSHEDSSEHRRHARETGDGVDVESRRGGSYTRPGSSSLGSGSLHTGHGSSGLGSGYHGSSGLGSGSLHSGSGYHGSSGLGSGSHHSGSGYHGSSGLGSGSHHSGSGYHGSSGLGSGSLHSGSGYHGSSGLGSGSLGHHRRPSSVRAGGTISDNDDASKITGKSGAEVTSTPDSGIAIEGDNVRLTNPEYSCLYSNVRDEVLENRRLECNGAVCSLLDQSDRHTVWKCGQYKCNILKFDVNKPLPSGLVFQCVQERALITAPRRCPAGSKLDWAGKCRAEY